MSQVEAHIDFDDALALAERDFVRTRVLVLCGESGSGKSSAIRFLMHQHRHFWRDPHLRVIEELRTWRDLGIFLGALWRGQRLLVASHLPVWLHRGLGLLAATDVIALDRHPEKIRRWLEAHQVSCSEAALIAFCSRFGANYTDARLILQHAESRSFDHALGRFLRQCQLQREDIPSGQTVRVMPVAEAEAHYRAMNEVGVKHVP